MAQVSDVTPCPAIPDDRDGPTCDGLNYALSALSFVPDAGAPTALFGTPGKLPSLQPRQRQDLDAGKSIVTASLATASRSCYLVRRIITSRGARGLLVGAIYDEYLWGTPEQNPLIPTMQLHIVDRAGEVLFRSIKGDVSLPPKVARNVGTDSSGTFEWEVGERVLPRRVLSDCGAGGRGRTRRGRWC